MVTELELHLDDLVTRRFDDAGPTLQSVGEAELLSRLAALARAVPQPRLVVGSGDDAAVYRPEAGLDMVVSQDAMVEGQDFSRDWISPYGLGRRALHVALSDLAGSGASPEFCLATLCAPGTTRAADALAIQAGLCDAAAEIGCGVAGGDVSGIEGSLVIDVAVVGRVGKGRHLGVALGQPGDCLVVSGLLGRAAAGLALLRGRTAGDTDPAVTAAWGVAQLAPRARLAEGLELAARGVACATDISDGLLVAAINIARASGCAAELWRDAVPVDAALKTWPDWFELAVAGGEDFELLAAVAPDQFEALVAAWPADLEPLSPVGRLYAGSGVVCRARQGAREIAVPIPRSFHFG